jgi:hypothetical protein
MACCATGYRESVHRMFQKRLFSPALANDQSDIVVLFTGAELFDLIDNRHHHRLLRLASMWWPFAFALAIIYFVFISRRMKER